MTSTAARAERMQSVVEYVADNPGVTVTDIVETFGMARNTALAYLRENPDIKNLVVDTRVRPARWSDADIAAALDRAADLLPPSAPLGQAYYDKVRLDNEPPSVTIVARHGSWASAMEEYGHEPTTRSREYVREFDEDRIVWWLARWMSGLHPNARPSYRSYEEWASSMVGAPSAALVKIRFGKWSEAVKAAIKETHL